MIVSLIWAGIVIGGAWIAAPAKFTVETLDMAELLAVGRVQFLWLGRVEIACVVVVALGFLASRTFSVAVALAIAASALQHVFVLPRLGLLTEARIAGIQPDAGQHLHLVYIGLDVIKVVCLLIGAALYMRRMAE